MSNGPFKILAHAVLILAMASVVVSCGRRGNLERPPEASVISVDPDGQEVKEAPKEDKPFILDPLL